MEIRYTAEFKRNLRHLAKRYRNSRNDIDPILKQLKQRQMVGTQITGIGETLFKVSVLNRDARRGKSGDSRVAATA